MSKFSTSLMIGGTGMLSGAATWMAERSDRLVVVSRRAVQSPLAKRSNVAALSADWRHFDEFADTLARAGGFKDMQLAVLWMHRDGEQAKQRVLEELSSHDCLIVNVRGSAALAELGDTGEATRGFGARARLVTVTLGAVPTATGQRWLTWDEISDGTITAIETGKSGVVGRLP